jgi:hypothetical protein
MDEKQHQHDVIIVVANGSIEVAQQLFLHSCNFELHELHTYMVMGKTLCYNIVHKYNNNKKHCRS